MTTDRGLGQTFHTTVFR